MFFLLKQIFYPVIIITYKLYIYLHFIFFYFLNTSLLLMIDLSSHSSYPYILDLDVFAKKPNLELVQNDIFKSFRQFHPYFKIIPYL